MDYRDLAFVVSISFVVVISSCRTTEETAREPTGFETLSGPYFGQKSPGSEPKVFMPGLVSTTDNDRCVTFLDHGNLCVFVRDLEGVRYTVEKDGRWTVPESGPLVFEYYTKYREFDFTAAPDGRGIYFQSARPTDPEDTQDDHNIWVVDWTGSNWGEPRPLPAPVNTEDHSEAYPTVTSSGTVYLFSGQREDSLSWDIYRSRYVNGEYLPQERLEWPINTEFDELDPYVAPDESYLMFGSRRPGGFGRDDTYISFRREEGSWTHPINIGRPLNSSSWENRINVTPDGRYFFFSSVRATDLPKGEKLRSPVVETYGDSDVYWVDTTFINDLKLDVFHKQCAADILREEYQENGLQSTLAMLQDLYEKKENFYFPIYELLAISESMMQAGEVGDSESFYEALLGTLSEGHRIELGYSLLWTMKGSVDEGLAMLKEALVGNPSDLRWEVHLRVNDLLLSSRYEDALKALRFNVEEFPDWPLAYTKLALFHEERGDRNKALENCLKALELNPDDREANALLRRLGEQ
jgi:tetratricopeptide (TPR) repeat protein